MLTYLSFVMLLASAQPPSRTAAVAPQSDVTIIARGWTALSAGRASEAERLAEQVLTRDPSNHHAIGLKIQAQASGRPDAALDTYERWLGQRHDEDLGLLAVIAEGVLRQAIAGWHSAVSAEARRYLDSRGANRSVSAAELQRLQKAAQDTTGTDKTGIAESLGTAGAQAVPTLIDLVDHARGPNRAAAAQALGRLQDPRAEAALLRAFDDQDPFVRASAAVALARIGNTGGQNFVATMLASDVADLRLMAADAWGGQPGPWVDAVRPLLDDGNPLIKVRAAGKIAAVDPEAAGRTLAATLGDANPVIRAESAKTLATVAAAHPDAINVAALRGMLHDPDVWIRVYAAGALREANAARP